MHTTGSGSFYFALYILVVSSKLFDPNGAQVRNRILSLLQTLILSKEIRLHDHSVCVSPSVRGQLLKMLITVEPHGVF